MESNLLRDRLTIYSEGRTDTVYVKGIRRAMHDHEILELLATIEEPLETDFSQRNKTGEIWAKYSSQIASQQTILFLHQRCYHGSYICARFELGLGSDGRRIPDRSSHNTVIRSIRSNNCVNGGFVPVGHTYNSDSLLINSVDYPFPSGLYLSRLLFLSREYPPDDPLLSMITDPSLGNKYAKEVSEAMAMVDAVDRAFKLIHNNSASAFTGVRVLVVGDGKRPLCAACLCLHFPATWTYYSIDPIMKVEDVGSYSTRFFQHCCLSQEFIIPDFEGYPSVPEIPSASVETNKPSSMMTVVVACHSHAPLQEFLSRISGSTVVVTMPCCADYSDVHTMEQVLQFEDFEVYSPKRTVHIYKNPSPP